MTTEQLNNRLQSERIVEAAIRQNGEIYRAIDHSSCMKIMIIAGLTSCHGEQGFVTSVGRFVDRIEGADIAIRAVQVDVEKVQRRGYLFSEDLIKK